MYMNPQPILSFPGSCENATDFQFDLRLLDPAVYTLLADKLISEFFT